MKLLMVYKAKERAEAMAAPFLRVAIAVRVLLPLGDDCLSSRALLSACSAVRFTSSATPSLT